MATTLGLDFFIPMASLLTQLPSAGPSGLAKPLKVLLGHLDPKKRQGQAREADGLVKWL